MKTTFNKILTISLVLITLIVFSGTAWGAYSTAPAGTYNLVTKASDLAAGDVIIIAGTNSGTTKAISTTQNSNNRGTVEVTLSNNSITLAANNTVQGITLEAGSSSGTFSFNTGDGYLCAASSSSNYLRTEATKSANSSWTISISSNLATVTAQGSYTRCLMRYNYNNNPPIYACYATNTSTGVAVNIYKKAASGYTVDFAVNTAGYGTVSPSAQLKNITSGTAITKGTGANVNQVTVNGTTITATPHAQDADYNYAFSNWSVTDNLTTVTKNITITANFTRTERALTNYRTKCCTSLGSINGSVSLTNEGCAAGELKATWKTSSTGLDGIASQTVKVYRADNNNEVTGLTGLTGKTAQTTNQTVTISGLTPCVEYYVKIWNVSKDGSYCESDFAGDKSSNVAAASYTITKTGVTNVTAESLSAIPATTCPSGFNATIVAASGYDLPGTITVTGANHTWNQATGALTISNVTGNVVITITPTEAQCTPLTAPSVTVSGKDYPYDAVTLSWTAVEHADGYTVEIYDGEAKIEGDDLDGGADSYTIGTTLAANKTYTYKVKATSETPATYCPSEWATDDFTTADYPSATLTLSEVGGEDYNLSGTHKLFDVVKLPSTLTYAGCTGKVLVGWSSVAIETPGSKPTSNYWDKGADYSLSSTSGKLYAVYATETPGSTSWDETALSSLGAGDVFVIVGNNGSNYAMTNNNGTSNPPAASSSVTVSSTHLTGTIADNIKWNISGDATNGYTFYPNGSTTTWLYCTSANNGVRVGTNDSKTFKPDNAGYLKHDGTSRYVGIYNSQDWRCYTSSDGNIANQTFKYYKLNVTAAVYSNYTTACAAALANPTFSPTEDAAEEYLAAQDLTINGPTGATIYYTMSTDGNEPDDPTDESDEYTSAISMNSRATYWIKAFAKKDASESEIVEAKYNINLPFTVAEAIAEIPNEGDERAKTYIDGIVCTAGTAVSDGEMIYYISDDGTETNRICIWYGKGLNNDEFTDVTDLKVGDKVRVYGLLNNTNGTTYGHYYVDNSYLTYLQSATVSSIEIGGTATKTAYTAGDNTFSYAGLTATATYNTGYVKDVTSEATWKANEVTSYTVTETEDVSVTATFGGQTSDAMVVGVTYTTKTVKSIYLEYESTYTYKGMALPKPKVYAKYVEEIADEEVTSLVEAAASGYDTENAYNKDVVDTYTINVAYQSKEATYTVEVRAIFNDVDHPYTPSEATTIIVEAIGENQSSDYIYVAGKVSAIDGSIDNNTLKYYISYDGTTTGQLYVYKGKYINNANFTNNNILVVGDEVVVKAQAQNYQGETPELKSSQVLKHYRAPEFTFADIVAGDEFEYDYSIDLAVTPTKNTGNAEFTLESDDESIVSIVDGKLHAAGVGTTKITASREATNLANQMNYSAKTAEFNVTVIAKRTRYTITFDDGGADGGSAPEAIANQLAGATVNLPASCSYSWPKHGFTGWAVTAGETPVEVTDGHFTMPEANVTITAQWAEIATTQIIFNVNGSTNVIAAVDVPQNEEYELTQTTDPINGYTFVGWAESPETEDVETVLTTISTYTPEAGEANKTLYAVFKRVDEGTPKTDVLTAADLAATGTEYENFSGVSKTSNAVYVGNSAKDNAGSIQLRSKNSNSGIVSTATGGILKSVTINVASGSNTIDVYGSNTAYSAASDLYGTGNNASQGTKIGSTSSTATINAEADYKFVGIRSNNGAIYLSSVEITWLPKTTYYTTAPSAVYAVSYVLGESGAWEGDACDGANVKAGKTFDICESVPVREHYKFVKWQVAGEDVNGTITINAATAITAVWEAKVENDITYNAGTGTGSDVVVEDVEEGTVVTLKAIGSSEGQANFTKSGYDFVGWLKNGVLYKAGETFEMPATAVTLTAQWKMQNVEKMSLITDASQLVDGMEVVLAYQDADNADKSALNGDIQSSKDFLDAVTGTDGVTFDNTNKTISYTSGVVTLIVEKVEGGWTLRKDASNYLKENSAKNIAWTTQEYASVWTINFEGENAIITATNPLRFNTGYPRFTTYASGQADIQLYGKATVISGTTSISEIGYVDGDVIVLNEDATLTVNDDIAPTTMIVPQGSTVTVNNNQKIDANTLIVERGGTLDIQTNGTVKTDETFVIYSTLGKGNGGTSSGNAPGSSSQIKNANKINATGDVFFELELTQETKASAGWYAFSVPFPVDAMTGVYYGNTQLQNEVGYAIMSYHGDKRAAGEYAWKKYRDIMMPGVLYIIAVGDTDYKTLRFKKHGNEAFSASTNVAVKRYSSEIDDTYAGWNGIGNPSMQVSYLPATNNVYYMQFLDHANNRFQIHQRSKINLVVGSAFFIQYRAADGQIAINTGLQDGASGYLAPTRERSAVEESIYEISLFNTATNEVEDNVFITAREEATNSYEIGRDVAKMIMGTAKCAQMSIQAYGKQLGAADFPLVNGQAAYPLTITAPAAGTYTISTEAQDNADIYLTQDGAIIWNLSMGEYELNLTQGTMNDYGLLLIEKAPGIATGVDEISGEKAGVQKIVIEDKVFILRGGKMYDVTGKAVK